MLTRRFIGQARVSATAAAFAPCMRWCRKYLRKGGPTWPTVYGTLLVGQDRICLRSGARWDMCVLEYCSCFQPVSLAVRALRGVPTFKTIIRPRVRPVRMRTSNVARRRGAAPGLPESPGLTRRQSPRSRDLRPHRGVSPGTGTLKRACHYAPRNPRTGAQPRTRPCFRARTGCIGGPELPADCDPSSLPRIVRKQQSRPIS